MTLALERVADVTDAERDDIQAAFDRFDPPEGFRAELIEGRFVMSPTPAVVHGEMLDDLIEFFLRDRKPKNTRILTSPVTIELPNAPGRDCYVPDLCVIERVAKRDLREWKLSADAFVLTAEVVSPASARDDRVVKPRGYASGMVPLYLLIDPLRSETTLFSEPNGTEYRAMVTMPFGGKIPFPEPFGGVLDTSVFLP